MLVRQIARAAGVRSWSRSGGAGAAVQRAWGPASGGRDGAALQGRNERRAFSAEKVSEEHVPDAWKNAWKHVAPNLDLPKFPVAFMANRPPVPDSIPPNVKLNLVLPYRFEIQNKDVDMVIIPATTGQFGILPGHVPTVAELKPGLLSIHEGDKVQTFFVSSGFAFAHQNSVLDVVAIEAVPLDQVDSEEVKKLFDEYTQKFNSANTDLEKAEAQIGVEVYGSLNTLVT